MPAPTVIFDLDGTLVETAPDLIGALNAVFMDEGLPALDPALARNMIGGGARRMMERGLELEQRPLIADEIDRMLRNFIDHYAAHIADRSRPFPGVVAALDQLEASGCIFAVCTNKLEGLSRRLLDALGLAQRFRAICGPDTFGIHKPDPEILRRTVTAAGGSIERAVMVGDSGTDVATARAAAVPIVAVDFGYSDPPVALLRPDRLISHFNDLASAISELAAD